MKVSSSEKNTEVLQLLSHGSNKICDSVLDSLTWNLKIFSAALLTFIISSYK